MRGGKGEYGKRNEGKKKMKTRGNEGKESDKEKKKDKTRKGRERSEDMKRLVWGKREKVETREKRKGK